MMLFQKRDAVGMSICWKAAKRIDSLTPAPSPKKRGRYCPLSLWERVRERAY
jgi:hypothetical protein